MAGNFETNSPGRDPRPDDFLRMIRRAHRGKLKIYLGYAAGVGKTYQMLEEARQLRSDGIDVVVGLVETHGRQETAALLEGLELIPRLQTVYRGVMIEEMDVEGLRARKPAVALVDELAHTNAPGSKNQKRYQDVQDLLADGIHVITTLNVQHLESLYDTVESSLRVKVRERIPDSVVLDADEIVNVDITEDDLRRRLEEGKVYTEERVGTALDSFFKRQNLEMLRELTLRELASQIDQRRRGPSGEAASPTPDQVMVCLSSRGPNSNRLLRYASRIAGRLNRTWYAVYVQTHREDPLTIDAQTQRHLSNTLTLAHQLGAMVFTYKGEDVAGTLLQFAKEYRVGQIVIGRPGKRLSLVARLLGRKDIVEDLVQRAEGVTVIVLDTRDLGQEAQPLPLAPLAGAELSPGASALPLRIQDYLGEASIRLWQQPVSTSEILRELVEAACGQAPAIEFQPVLAAVRAREAQGSTFFNEGAAFPHARIEGLDRPRIAIGLPRMEISDLSNTRPTAIVFLLLIPAEKPELMITLLAAASRIAKDPYASQQLARSTSAAQALQAFLDL